MANNLSTTSFKTDLTSEASDYFNNYYTTLPDVTSDIDDTIIGFFENITGNSQSARIMASAFLFTTLAQQMDPMVMLDQMRTMSMEEKNKFLNMYLNLNRVGTSYLGNRGQRQNNRYLERMLNPRG